jgi:hypothetical protein
MLTPRERHALQGLAEGQAGQRRQAVWLYFTGEAFK